MAASPGSTALDASHETAGARQRNADSYSALWHSRGRQHNVRFASCWKIAPVVSGRAVGVVCSYWTEAVRSSHSGRVVPSPTALITSMLEDVDGGMWMGTLDGLFHRLASGDVLPEPTAARAGIRNVRALVRDDDGRLWVGHDEGLLVLGPGAAGQLASSTPRQLRPCGAGPPRQRRLRLPTGSEDACTMTLDDGLIDQRVRALAIGSDGHVRVGTVAVLSVIDGAQITNVTHGQGLVQDAINTVSEDPDGNVWIGTDTSGAVRIAAFGLVSYFVPDGLRHDYIPFLMEGDSGRVIAVSGYRFTVNEFDGRRFAFARFNVPPDAPDDRYFSVLRDRQGAWWRGYGDRSVSIPASAPNSGPRTRAARGPLCPAFHVAKRRSVPAFRGHSRRHLADRPVVGSRQTSSAAPCDKRLPDIHVRTAADAADIGLSRRRWW